MSRLFVSLSFAAALSVASAAELQPVGLVPAAADQARDGEEWLGLFPTEVGWEVRATRLEVTALPEGSQAFEGVHDVRAVEAVQPLVVFRGLDEVSPGAVSAVSPRVDRDGRVLLGPSGVRPWLELEARNGDSGLYLHRDGARLLLTPWQSSDEQPALLWAGDLDRDGRLDFLLELSGPDAARTTLMLSRGADPDRAAVLGAEHRTD